MAKVENTTRTVTEYTLTLTEEEAVVLYRLVGNHVYGGGRNRDLCDRIYSALNEGFNGFFCKPLPTDTSGRIRNGIYLVKEE